MSKAGERDRGSDLGMKRECHFIRPVVMGFHKAAEELL